MSTIIWHMLTEHEPFSLFYFFYIGIEETRALTQKVNLK